METPRIIQTKNGWLALGNGWAVEASTEEDVMRKFKDAEIRHHLVESRPHWYYETKMNIANA